MASTDKELVAILEERNKGRYNHIIENAKRFHYHDFKQPDFVAQAPKTALMAEMRQYPELKDIVERVAAGEFDEEPDEDDKNEVRKSFFLPDKRIR